MKFNTTYSPKTTLKETLINIEKIKKSILNFYNKKYKLIQVTPPLHDLENSENSFHVFGYPTRYEDEMSCLL